MTSNAKTAEEYLNGLAPDRKGPVTKLRNEVLKNLPKGFTEEMNYGMLGYVVPHILYPAGYHCDPTKPLPFAHIASQKNFIAFYHMGIYSDPALLQWFLDEYNNDFTVKLDMGKSCMRFKKPETIPYTLIGRLMKKVKPEDWIKQYEKVIKKQPA